MVLLDTDILVDYLRNLPEAVDFISGQKDGIAVSPFTRMELTAGCADLKSQRTVVKMLDTFHQLETDHETVLLGIVFFENHRLSHGIGMVDALIAAAAVTHNMKLHTRNIKHYRCIRELELAKPY